MKKTLTSLLLLGACSYSFALEPVPKVCVTPKDEGKLAIQWYQASAEKHALYMQTYLMATNYLENWIKKHNPEPKSWGVVLDIDETVLDNTWAYTNGCLNVVNDDDDFSKYVVLPQKSRALMGAKDFVEKVHKFGGYVSMVSNRDGSYNGVLEATVHNLKKEDIYFDQIMLANIKASKFHAYDKNYRFEAIESGSYKEKTEFVADVELPAHKLIAYLGDNIQDFPRFKQRVMNSSKYEEVTYRKFGEGYFMLPNPIYGSWENSNALYKT